MPKNYCNQCGNPVQPTDLYCRSCGASLGVTASAEEPAQPDLSEPSRAALDSGSDVRSEIYTQTNVNPKNGLATTSLVLGILAVIVHFVFGINWSGCLGPLAILTGVISLFQIKKQGSPGRGTAITGIILGVLPIIITFVAIMLLTLTSVPSN